MINIRALDTYLGRIVEEIGGTQNEWYVILEGEVRITCKSDEYEMPSLEGTTTLKFVNVVYASDTTTMVLYDESNNEWRVILDPINYQIFDKSVQDTGWFPQVPLVAPAIPPWPFGDIEDDEG